MLIHRVSVPKAIASMQSSVQHEVIPVKQAPARHKAEAAEWVALRCMARGREVVEPLATSSKHGAQRQIGERFSEVLGELRVGDERLDGLCR